MTFGLKVIDGYDLLMKDIPPIKYLVNKIIMEGGLNYLSGKPGTFKTSFSFYIAINGAIGRDVFGYQVTKPFKTLILDEENGERGTRYKFEQIMKGMFINFESIKGKIFFDSLDNFHIDESCINTLKLMIKKYDVQLVVVDNITRTMIGDENDQEEVSKILALLKPLMIEFNVAFLILHHNRKGYETDLDSMRGSSDFGGQCDISSILDFYKKEDDFKMIYNLRNGKNKYDIPMEPINFSVEKNDGYMVIHYIGTVKEGRDTIIAKIEVDILTLLRELPTEYLSRTQIKEGINSNYRKSSIDSALKNLLKNNKIVRIKQGKSYNYVLVIAKGGC
jgi:RecA-family ATPase